MPPGAEKECQELDLAQAATTLVDECRMVLPGIQAIFGFQLIAAFNERFAKELGPGEQLLHLAAMCLVALAARQGAAAMRLRPVAGPGGQRPRLARQCRSRQAAPAKRSGWR